VRFLPALLLLAWANALSAESQPAYPLWDGSESIERYAERASLSPTKTLDLGSGVKLEMVLIPGGKFTMGLPASEPPWIGGAIFGIAGLTALILVGMSVARAIGQRRWPQFSLRWLILLVVSLGVAQYGVFRWYRASWARIERPNSEESPAHEVTIGAPYYMGKFEVMQEQYEQVMGKNPGHFQGHDLPVETVSWEDAQEFCRKATGWVGYVVRLPTEAEWERACGAGTRTAYCTGDAEADLDRIGWSQDNSKGKTHPVGEKEANGFGLYDMHGNVLEWCEDDWHAGVDWYEVKWHAGYDGAPEDGSAWVNSPRGKHRVLRGGSWLHHPRFCRLSCRHYFPPRECYDFTGFRVAVSIAATP
jgi:formylglycine-generating enzyme required for sulfatase activity